MGPKMVMLYCVLCWCVGRCVIRSIFSLKIPKLWHDNLIGVEQWIYMVFIWSVSFHVTVLSYPQSWSIQNFSHKILDLLDLSMYFERCSFLSYHSQQFILKNLLASGQLSVTLSLVFFKTVPRHVRISLRGWHYLLLEAICLWHCPLLPCWTALFLLLLLLLILIIL